MEKFERVTTTILRAAMHSAAVISMMALASGCTSDDAPFDPQALQRNERLHAREDHSQPMRPLPTTLESNYLPPKNGQAVSRPSQPPTTGQSLEKLPQVRMSLQDIIHRAAVNNLDVKVSAYQPAIDASRTIEADARFDPTVFVNTNFEHRNNDQAFSTVTSAGNKDRENIFTSSFGVQQNLESGGQIKLAYSSNHTDVNQGPFGQVDPNPFVENNLVLQLTQPLLQNFGLEVNRARITIARNNAHISLLDFRKQIEETTADIEKTYWQLVQAEREVQIANGLLNQTMRTAKILLDRFGQDVTRVQLSQANASVESRRAALVRAKAQVEDLSDQLKRLMNDPELTITSPTLVLPADAAMEEPCHFELQDEINTAMQNRFELGQQQIRINSADIAAAVAKNNELPALNFQGQVGYQGLGDSFVEGFHNQAEFNNLNWQMGLQFEYPIGNRAAHAITRRAHLQQYQAIDQYKNLVEQVALDVKKAWREVDTSWNEMIARRQSRFAAADSLSAIEQRELGGEPLTPTFVNLKLDTQERLADALRQEIGAVVGYNIAISRLEFSKGTLLRYNNIVMQEEDVPSVR